MGDKSRRPELIRLFPPPPFHGEYCLSLRCYFFFGGGGVREGSHKYDWVCDESCVQLTSRHNEEMKYATGAAWWILTRD